MAEMLEKGPVVTLKEAAANKIKEYLNKEGKPECGIRLQVVGGGCSGLQYRMSLDDKVTEMDEIYESRGVKMIIDRKSALYLIGTEMDYEDSITGGGFRFSNPNAAGKCGCGESFRI